jgi:hypothetical protein
MKRQVHFSAMAASFACSLDGDKDAQHAPYPARIARLEKLFHGGSSLQCARLSRQELSFMQAQSAAR